MSTTGWISTRPGVPADDKSGGAVSGAHTQRGAKRSRQKTTPPRINGGQSSSTTVRSPPPHSSFSSPSTLSLSSSSLSSSSSSLPMSSSKPEAKKARLAIQTTPKGRRKSTASGGSTTGWSSAADVPRPYAPPPALDAQLMAFQRDGIKFALAQKGRCLIGDDMGESWTTDWGCPALRELSLPTHISQRSRPQLDGQCCVRAPKRQRKRRHPPQLPLTDIVGHGLALPLTHSLTPTRTSVLCWHHHHHHHHCCCCCSCSHSYLFFFCWPHVLDHHRTWQDGAGHHYHVRGPATGCNPNDVAVNIAHCCTHTPLLLWSECNFTRAANTSATRAVR
jgi:hypothetical protein